MKTLLVTGGAGYIGSHVVRQLSEADYRILVVDDLSTGFADSLIGGEKLFRGPAGDARVLEDVFGDHEIDAVLHFAASLIVPESVEKPADYYANNTVTTLRLLQECTRRGVKKFIFSSTAAVYGTPAGGVASEESPLQPCSPYGHSKLMSEIMLRDIALAQKMRFAILRYFNVAGADPQARMGQRSPLSTHLIRVCCEAALGVRPQVEVFGNDYETPDGSALRDYIHVEDLASAHLKALDFLDHGNESITLNVGYGTPYSVLEVIKMVKDVTGVNFPTRISPRRQGDPSKIIACADRIRGTLAWQPQFASLRTIIEDAWRWEKTRALK